MGDLIDRQAAIDAVKKNTFRLTFAEEQNCEGHLAWSANAVYSDVIEGALLELPSAQPEIVLELLKTQPTIEPRKKGKWRKKYYGLQEIVCSECGHESKDKWFFCPCCGARMTEGGEE